MRYFDGADFKSDIGFWKSRAQMPSFGVFWAKEYELSNLNEILHVPYFEGADFKSFICFRKFWIQITKSIN